MYIIGVSISGFHKIEDRRKYLFNFEGFNYLYGENGSGKSTILQAIQWALFGYIPGTNKLNTAIYEHASKPEMKVEVRLCGGDNDELDEYIVIRSLKLENGKLVESLTTYPESIPLDQIVGDINLPILNWSEFNSLSSNKKKDLLISILPSSTKLIDSKNYLIQLKEYTQNSSAIVDDVCEQYPSLNSIEDIKKLNELLKATKSIIEADKKRLLATIQSLIYYDDCVSTRAVDELKADIQQLSLKRDAALKFESQQSNMQQYKSKLSEYDDLYETIESDSNYAELLKMLNTLKSANISLDSKCDEIRNKINEIEYDYAQLNKIIESRGICPFIESDCEIIGNTLDESKIKLQKFSDQLHNLNNELFEIKESIKNNTIKINNINSQLSDIEVKYKSRDNLKSLLMNQLDYEGQSSSELGQMILQLQDELAKVSANLKYDEMMETVQQQKLVLEEQSDFIKSAIKATGPNGLQSSIVKKPFELMIASMNNYFEAFKLSNLGQVKFILEEKANSFNFGLVRSKFIPFELLSSGEQCIFTLIFMLSLSSISDSKIDFLLIDDLFDHLDSTKFDAIINDINLISNGRQLIVAGVNFDIKDKYKESIQIIDVNSDYF